MPKPAEPDPPPRPLSGDALLRALIEAGIIPANTTRVVLDILWRQEVTLYLETLADERLLGLVPLLPGVTIIRDEPREGRDNADER